jgi:hypothetical protein
MPLYSADITALNTLIDRATKTINWLSGNSDEFAVLHESQYPTAPFAVMA